MESCNVGLNVGDEGHVQQAVGGEVWSNQEDPTLKKKISEIKLAQSICVYMVDILHMFKEKRQSERGEARLH